MSSICRYLPLDHFLGSYYSLLLRRRVGLSPLPSVMAPWMSRLMVSLAVATTMARRPMIGINGSGLVPMAVANTICFLEAASVQFGAPYLDAPR